MEALLAFRGKMEVVEVVVEDMRSSPTPASSVRKKDIFIYR